MRKSFCSKLAGLVALASLTAATLHPASAAGDPRPPLSDFLSFSMLNEWVARAGLLAARSMVDLTYHDITSDPYANRFTVSGLGIYPALPWDRGRQCQILAERLSLSFIEAADRDRLAIRLELIGMTAPLACLPPAVAGGAAVMEIVSLSADRMFIDIDYRMNSSAMRATVHVTLPDLAAVTANLDFSYVALHEKGDNPVILDLRHAAVTLDDMGLWQKAKKSMVPEMTQPDAAAQIVAETLTGLFVGMNPPSGSKSRPQLDIAQVAFVQSAAEQVRQFVTKPETLVIETALEMPVRLNDRTLDDSGRLFAAARLSVASRPASRQQIVPINLLKAALTAPASLSKLDKLRVGRALVSGVGAPQALSRGQFLLRPLADAGNGEAALVLAASLRVTDPETAYRLALKAGATRTADAAGIMDQLEQDLTTSQVLTLQGKLFSAASAMRGPHVFVPLTQVRAKALAHLRGNGAVRSYVRAYYWALLAKAAGDQAGASIAGEIESRMRFRGPKAAAAWRSGAEQARTDALVYWLGAGYPARLLGQ